MIVVSDTSPICYLFLIGCQDVLPILFDRVILPQAVCDEMKREGAPLLLQTWIAQPPDWIEVQSVVIEHEAELDRLHPGEREVIVLAERLKADLVLLDEKAARQVAEERGLRRTGLLGILDEAATRGLIDLPTAIERLQHTTFRASPRLLKLILDRHQKRRENV